MQPVLQARNLVKHFGRVTALDGADFDLLPGEILAVIGDNGAGKSVMIKSLTGAIQLESGDIRLQGEPIHFHSPIAARLKGIETVYQTLALSPALSTDNMFMGRELRYSVFAEKFSTARQTCYGKICARKVKRTRSTNYPEHKTSS